MAATTAMVWVLMGVCLVVIVSVLAWARVQIAKIEAQAGGGLKRGRKG
ncbi:MAG TPA: hypothetical protein VK545_21115 [Streptomyces sp.]|nr:hypothetical protein [Streptomyces sp.]